MEFELSNVKCKLAHFNPRSELNGEDRHPAADLKLEMALATDALAMFGPQLRAAWYEGDDSTLRNPSLQGPFAHDGECIGATLTIHHGFHQGLGGNSDLVLGECEVNGFRLTPQGGGTIIVACRVQCHPDEKAAGKLYSLVQSDIEVSLVPAQGKLDLGSQA